MTIDNSTTNPLKEKHMNTLRNLKQLQETEKYLFESLPNMKNKSNDAVQQTISQINNMRFKHFNFIICPNDMTF